MRICLMIFACAAICLAVMQAPPAGAKTQAAAGIPQEIADAVRATDYDAVRIKSFPIAMQAWTYRKFTFFEMLDRTKALGITRIQAYPGQKLDAGDSKAVFSHDMDAEARKRVKDALAERGMTLVAYGVVDLGTTEDGMRKVFDFARDMGVGIVVCEPRDADFTLIEKMVRATGVQVAIHNHPPPTTYAQPGTVLERVAGRDVRIGTSADTGHWMRTGLDPVECLRLLKGRIVDVHLKDRSDFGIQGAGDVPFGDGKADIRRILAELTLQDYAGHLTIEYENEAEVENPEPAIRKGLEFIRGVTYYWDYEQILGRSGGRYNKHGWNHYGPGHFTLDAKSGVLESVDGMGLFWYSRRMFRDFVLDFEYKCSQKTTNSGVFVRVPEVPTSDDYIYHSFEIQINDAGRGIHRTGAVYDAEAPTADAEKPTGEWNHMRITLVGKRIRVELNGVAVLDWEAEPRGKVRDFAEEGYIGLQNHDSISPVFFRNIFIKELRPD